MQHLEESRIRESSFASVFASNFFNPFHISHIFTSSVGTKSSKSLGSKNVDVIVKLELLLDVLLVLLDVELLVVETLEVELVVEPEG